MANLIKVSEEEAFLLSGETDFNHVIAYFKNLTNQNVVITCGADGAWFSNAGGQRLIKSPQINQIDSTGAGDAFIGALLFKLASTSGKFDWDSAISFANEIGGLTCTKIGAIEAMPTMSEYLNR